VKAGRTRLGLAILVLLISLSGCTLDNIAARQGKATELWDELLGGQTFGQSFVIARNDLYRIDLGTATYARINSAPVIFHLQTGPEASTDIISVRLSGPEIENERPTTISFSPIPDSKGKRYYFYIESPEAAPGNAITLYANAYDQYPDGSAYRNGEAVAGDLVFTAYSRQTFAFSGILQGFLSRVAEDVPFLICYATLIMGACAGLLASLFRRLPSGR
jgi:hypothetical protein